MKFTQGFLGLLPLQREQAQTGSLAFLLLEGGQVGSLFGVRVGRSSSSRDVSRGQA